MTPSAKEFYLLCSENVRLKMGIDSGNNLRKGTFGTNISFDIDDVATPAKRRTRQTEEHNEVVRGNHDSVTECPGCGSAISRDEWLECLVGFVSGAHEFEIGNPVRARIVQNLRNQASSMKVPSPREDWELAVVKKLMTQIEKIVLAEVSRTQPKQVIARSITDQERLELIAETEARVINTMAVEIQEALIAELTPRLEQEIRAQVEKELWQQFEEEWKNRSLGKVV